MWWNRVSLLFFFSSRRRHTRFDCDWSSDVCFPISLQANEGGGFGAVSMQDVRLQPPGQAHEAQPYQNVGGRWPAADGETMDAKLEAWRDFLEHRLRAFATGQAVGDDADVVAAIGLAVGEVQGVTEDSPDRCAHRVQDTKRLIGGRGHDQNQHSPTSAVSSGLQSIGISIPIKDFHG